jgi:hypothetical protein
VAVSLSCLICLGEKPDNAKGAHTYCSQSSACHAINRPWMDLTAALLLLPELAEVQMWLN